MLLHGAVAWASHVGGPFSGPTAVSGGTAYWNPAAIDAERDDFSTLLELGVSPINVTYQRADDPTTQRSFDKQQFSTLLPEPLFTIFSPTPVRWLKLQLGGYPLMGAGARWPADGPQRYFSGNSQAYAYAGQAALLWVPNDSLSIAVAGLVAYNSVDVRSSIDFGAFANNMLGSEIFPYEDPILEGRTRIHATGWSTGGALGVFGRPSRELQLGAALLLPRDAHMVGKMELDASAPLQQTLPGFELDPSGRVDVYYPLPWELHVGGAFDFGSTLVALQLWYSRRSVQQVIMASVTNASAEYVEGRQVSAKGVHDDWELAARLEQQLTDALRVAILLDFDPRYVPTESITPINLDFTRYEVDVGVRYRLASYLDVAFTVGYVYLTTVHVTNSLYNPRASGDSGLSLPSANGDYAGNATKIGLGIELHWPRARSK